MTVGGGLVRMAAWMVVGVFICGLVNPPFGELFASLAMLVVWLCGAVHLSFYAGGRA